MDGDPDAESTTLPEPEHGWVAQDDDPGDPGGHSRALPVDTDGDGAYDRALPYGDDGPGRR